MKHVMMPQLAVLLAFAAAGCTLPLAQKDRDWMDSQVSRVERATQRAEAAAQLSQQASDRNDQRFTQLEETVRRFLEKHRFDKSSVR